MNHISDRFYRQNKSERAMFSKHPQIKTPVVQKQYFCPVEGCSRHKTGKNPFPNMWPLKQVKSPRKTSPRVVYLSVQTDGIGTLQGHRQLAVHVKWIVH